MTGRFVQNLPKRVDIAYFSLNARPLETPRRKRRNLAAFLTGMGLFALGFGSLQAAIAAGLVKSSDGPIAFVAGQIQKRLPAPDNDRTATPNIVWTSLDPGPEPKRSVFMVVNAPQNALSLPGDSVCVRLCDGYYFPIGPVSRAGDLPDHRAACSSLCPDAPTQLFVEPTGSDRIEDAVSSEGTRYTALPAAFRNRATVDNACSCHRRASQSFSPLDDTTLRKGDSIMTPRGIVVFRGSGSAPYSQDDFTTLASAPMPKDKYETLAAIERATLPNVDQSSAMIAPPRKSRIAFAAPVARPKTTSLNQSIHFIERTVSASN
jgi:Protein of unknown function (DUF2865)